MAGRMILETARLALREFDEGDVEVLYTLGSNPAVTRYVGGPGSRLTSIEQAREVLESGPLADYRIHGFGRWACVLKTNGAVIGFAGLKFLQDLGDVDLGYRLLPEYWGAGLATEAGRAVVDYGFRVLQLERMIGLVHPENIASQRVMAKLGFTFVGLTKYLGDTAAKFAAVRPSPDVVSRTSDG